MLELPIISPYVYCRVDSNSFTMDIGQPYARVDFIPQSGTLDSASVLHLLNLNKPALWVQPKDVFAVYLGWTITSVLWAIDLNQRKKMPGHRYRQNFIFKNRAYTYVFMLCKEINSLSFKTLHEYYSKLVRKGETFSFWMVIKKYFLLTS